jgi:hypothetical protein
VAASSGALISSASVLTYRRPHRRAARQPGTSPSTYPQATRARLFFKSATDLGRPQQISPVLGPFPLGAALADLIRTFLASLRNHDGKGLQRTNEGRPARWLLSTNPE